MRIIHLIVFLSLYFASVSGYVFSCEEVKYKFVNQNLEYSTRYICVIPEAGYSVENLKKIFAQNDQNSTSFADIATSGNYGSNYGCIERDIDAPWRIVADVPVDLDCTKEFSLIFGSARNFIIQVGGRVSFSGSLILVAPNTGMKLHLPQCTCDGNITIHTGAGNGVAEFCYPMKSWSCADLPKWIVSFDNVITIAADDGCSLTVNHAEHDYARTLTVGPTDRLAAISSGRSDNLQNLHPERNVVIFTAGTDVVARTDISSSFDARYDGYLTISSDDSSWTKQYHNESSLHTDLPKARTMKLTYGSKTVAAQDLWDSQDNFVVEMKLSEPKAGIATGYCGCELDPKFGMPVDWNTTGIWIDVVIILDCSEAMGDQSLIKAINLIESFIGDEFSDVLITDVTAKFYTRVGLIAMSDTADVIYSLNMTKNDDLTGKVHIKKGVTQIDVVDAFEAAQNMFTAEMRPDRKNTRQVIYYMTDSDPKIITTGITQFKTSQGTIIVNDFVQEGEVKSPGLKELASDGYYSSDMLDNYMDSVQLFCKANCYCLPDKHAYNQGNSDPAVLAAGGCLAANPSGYPWSRSKSSCSELGNGGLLVSLHTDNKAQFASDVLRNVSAKAAYFWFGYSKSDDGSWQFEDKSTDSYTKWDRDEPSPNAVSKCGYVDMTSLYWGAGNCQTGFPSVCEFPPCMAGNIC